MINYNEIKAIHSTIQEPLQYIALEYNSDNNELYLKTVYTLNDNKLYVWRTSPNLHKESYELYKDSKIKVRIDHTLIGMVPAIIDELT